MPTAADVLGQYSNASLQQMARQRGLEVKGKNKVALIGELAPDLYDRERILRALDDLAPLERLLLDEVILAGGDVSTQLIKDRLEGEGKVEKSQGTNPWEKRMDARGSPWAVGSRRFADLVARLGVLGLMFASGPDGLGTIVELATGGRRLTIPDEILQHLPRPEVALQAVAVPEVVQSAEPGALLRDVYLLLSLADRAPFPLTARGQIAKRTLVQIDAVLQVHEGAAQARSEDDLGRLSFLRALLEELGLLVVRMGTIAAAEGAAAFVAKPAGERRRLLYEAYCRQRRWCELFRIPNLTINTRNVGRGTPEAVVVARRRILGHIAELPVGEWVSLKQVVGFMRRRDPEFMLSRTPSPGYYYGFHYQPNLYAEGNGLGWTFPDIRSEAQGWEVVEGGFILVVLVKALAWLGVVDVGESAGEAVAVRLTSDGARLLKGEEPPTEPAAPQVVVQPNFQIFAFPPTGEDVLFRLDHMAERIRAEQVFEYRLTRASVYRAQRLGIDTATIAAFLSAVSATPIPQNVQRTLVEWGEQHERIVVRQGVSLLHAVDEATLDALYADPALAGLLGRRLAPDVALVRPAELSSLYKRLLAAGKLAALSEGASEVPRPAVAVTAGGSIRFRERLPSVHLLHSLERFAETMEDGTLALSPASLRRAAESGLDAERIIAILASWNAGPLPEEVVANIRRLAKHWGRGALARVALLQVQSPDVLANLLADGEVGPYLRRVPGANTLAIVREGEVERVRAILLARGLDLSDSLLS